MLGRTAQGNAANVMTRIETQRRIRRRGWSRDANAVM
jgi:hypothetical protein